jgi:hypothetical protein
LAASIAGLFLLGTLPVIAQGGDGARAPLGVTDVPAAFSVKLRKASEVR